MEVSFTEPNLRELYEGRKITEKRFRYPPDLIKQFIKTVYKLESVKAIEELYQYKSLNYERLKGDRRGYSSVRINRQYRLIFEEIQSDEEPFEVRLLAIMEISNHYS